MRLGRDVSEDLSCHGIETNQENPLLQIYRALSDGERKFIVSGEANHPHLTSYINSDCRLTQRSTLHYLSVVIADCEYPIN